jgi:peptide/nickel transport system permease protein
MAGPVRAWHPLLLMSDPTRPSEAASPSRPHTSSWRVAWPIARLVLAFMLTMAGAVLAIQLLLWASPGDPVDLVPNGEEFRVQLEAEWGLDEPLPQRYLRFLGRALQGDLGSSLTYRPGAPVTELILPAAGRSLRLLLPALALSMLLGSGLGFLTAGRSSLLRRLAQVVSVAPVFLLAFLSVHLLNELAFHGMQAGWLERPSWFALPDTDSVLKTALAIAVLAVGSGALAEVHAAAEDELVRLRNAPFIDSAIARGAPVWKHLLWNLLPPLATIAYGRAAFFVGGLVIVEKVLHLNGAGSMLWQACRLRDYPVALGITVLAAAAVCGARLLGDLVRISVDPRLREAAR